MWEFEILGVDLYHVLALFWLYSFCGWIWESAYVSLAQKKLVNRGFVNGPLLTLYGTGAVSVYLILRPFADCWYVLYFGGVIVATVLEYVTGVLMEAIFHAHWWDYSRKKFNFQGKICLESSILWGFFTLLLFYVLQPAAEHVVDWFDPFVGKIIVIVVSLGYSVDFVFSAVAAFQLGRKLEQIEARWEEFMEYLQTSRLTLLADDLREKALDYRQEYSVEKIRAYLSERKDLLIESMEQLLASEEQEAKGENEKKQGHLGRLADFGAEQKGRLTEFNAEQRARLAALAAAQKERLTELGVDTADALVGKIDEISTGIWDHLEPWAKVFNDKKPRLNLIIRRYLKAYPHLYNNTYAEKRKGRKKELQEREASQQKEKEQ